MTPDAAKALAERLDFIAKNGLVEGDYNRRACLAGAAALRSVPVATDLDNALKDARAALGEVERVNEHHPLDVGRLIRLLRGLVCTLRGDGDGTATVNALAASPATDRDDERQCSVFYDGERRCRCDLKDGHSGSHRAWGVVWDSSEGSELRASGATSPGNHDNLTDYLDAIGEIIGDRLRVSSFLNRMSMAGLSIRIRSSQDDAEPQHPQPKPTPSEDERDALTVDDLLWAADRSRARAVLARGTGRPEDAQAWAQRTDRFLSAAAAGFHRTTPKKPQPDHAPSEEEEQMAAYFANLAEGAKTLPATMRVRVNTGQPEPAPSEDDREALAITAMDRDDLNELPNELDAFIPCILGPQADQVRRAMAQSARLLRKMRRVAAGFHRTKPETRTVTVCPEHGGDCGGPSCCCADKHTQIPTGAADEAPQARSITSSTSDPEKPQPDHAALIADTVGAWADWHGFGGDGYACCLDDLKERLADVLRLVVKARTPEPQHPQPEPTP